VPGKRSHAADAAAGIAVVGAAGFLGSALGAAAEAAGIPVDRYTRAEPALGADGGADPRLARVGTVFWLASSVNPALAETHPQRARADLDAFTALLRAVRGLRRPPRMVLLSTGGALYEPDRAPPYREDSPTHPRGAYGRLKLAMEEALAGAGLPAGRAVALRVSNVYGPGQPAVSGQGVVGYWLRAAAAGEHLTVYGDPGTTRDYVYLADVTEALLAVHAAAAPPPVLNIGSGRPTSLGELAGLLLDVVGNPELRLEQRPARGFDVPHTWLDVRRATETIGWTATTDLRTGLTLAWEAVPVPA
jgi:UDP-glucose 4-epimerase